MYPIIFSNSFFTLTTLGIFAVISLILFVWLLARFSAQKNRDIQFISDHFIFLSLSFLVGARFQAVVENWAYFANNFWQIFYAFWANGFSLFGGLIGLFLGLFYICVHKKESFLTWLDITSLALFPSIALVYLGQFLDGSNYGTPTDLPWGISYENATVPYSIPVHPTQIYFLLASVISFFILKYLLKNKSPKGFAGLISLIFFSLASFLIYYLSGEISMHIFGLRSAQVFAIMFIVIIAVLYFNAKNSKIIR